METRAGGEATCLFERETMPSLGGRLGIVERWDSPLEELVARGSPLRAVPLTVRILAVLVFVTASIVAIFAGANLAAGFYAHRGPNLDEGFILIIPTALLFFAGWAILQRDLWGWLATLVASITTIAHVALSPLALTAPWSNGRGDARRGLVVDIGSLRHDSR